MKKTAVYTPKEARYREIASVLRTKDGICRMIPGQPCGLAGMGLILMDAAARQNFPEILDEAAKLPRPPVLALFYCRGQEPPEGEVPGFDARLELGGDFSAHLAALLRKYGVRLGIFAVKIRKEVFAISAADIRFCEMDKHCVKLAAGSGSVKYWGVLEEEAEKLRPFGIIRIHKSYMVNLRFVRGFTASHVDLETGESFPLGRKYRQSFRSACEAGGLSAGPAPR